MNTVAHVTAKRPSEEMALNTIGRIVPLREAVDHAIADIDGIVAECRQAIDKAAAMHIYIVGNARRLNDDGGRFYAPTEDPDGDFNEHMAEAVGALKCLLSYVDKLRPEALSAKRTLAALSSEDQLDAAAEE